MRLLFAGAAVFFLLSCNQDGREKQPGDNSGQAGTLSNDTTKLLAGMSAEEKASLKESLMKEGKYDCCTKPGCTDCIGDKQECGCYLDIKKKDPICGECLDEYKAGHGKLKLMSIVELEEIQKKKGKRQAKPQ